MSAFCVTIGSYEGNLIGWECGGAHPQPKLTFAFNGHGGSVRCCAANDSGALLLTAAADESTR